MRRAPRAALVCVLLTSGCAEVGIPEPCAPGELPPIGQHPLVAAKQGEEAEDAGPKDAQPEDAAPTETETETETETDPEATAPEDTAPAETEPETDSEATAPEDTDPEEIDPADASADSTEASTGLAEGPTEAVTAIADPTPSTPADPFAAAREDVERSADWLLCVVPGQLPEEQLDAWVERRNLVMDWVENHPTLGYTFNASIMAPIHKDRRFYVSMYMNLAYAIGKARYLLNAEPADPIEAEVAGLEAVALYYATFRAAEPKLKARRLQRLMRKKHKGKLRKWVREHMSKI